MCNSTITAKVDIYPISLTILRNYTTFMAEKLLANIDDDPIPNIKVKRIIQRFTEPYIQYTSIQGFYSPSVADKKGL